MSKNKKENLNKATMVSGGVEPCHARGSDGLLGTVKCSLPFGHEGVHKSWGWYGQGGLRHYEWGEQE